MRISDWSSDVCSSDLTPTGPGRPGNLRKPLPPPHRPFSPPAAAARLGRRAYRRDEIGCLDKRRSTTFLLPSMDEGRDDWIHTSLSPAPDRHPGQASVSERDPGPIAPLGAWPIGRSRLALPPKASWGGRLAGMTN